MPETSGYELLDSGLGRKLERFGQYTLARPCSQAVWRPLEPQLWERADAAFSRDRGQRWSGRRLPPHWRIDVDGLRFELRGTDFGHLGIFPEQRDTWSWIRKRLARHTGSPPRLLNLFAYSGGVTLAAAAAGAEVCHLDASAGMVEWARANARLNGLEAAPIRWIVDDVNKFMRREARRARRYDAIVLDPPSFGRGAGGEVYKLERDLPQTLALCRELLSDTPLFVLLSAHTPGVTPVALENLLADYFPSQDGGDIAGRELLLRGRPGVRPIPSGAIASFSV